SVTNSNPSYHSRTSSVSLSPPEKSAAQTPSNASRGVRSQASTDGLQHGARKSRKKRGSPARARNHSSDPSAAAGRGLILKSPRGKTGRVRYVPWLKYNPIA